MTVDNAKTNQLTPEIQSSIPAINSNPPSIFKTLHNILDGKIPQTPYPIIPQVTSRSLDLVLIFALFSSKGSLVEPTKYCAHFNSSVQLIKDIEADPKLGNSGRIIEYVVSRGYNSWTVQSIPIGKDKFTSM